MAKYRHIHHLMTKDVKQIKRKYYTLVKGHLTISGTVEAPIGRLQEGNVKRGVREDGDHAQTPTVIRWRLLQDREDVFDLGNVPVKRDANHMIGKPSMQSVQYPHEKDDAKADPEHALHE